MIYQLENPFMVPKLLDVSQRTLVAPKEVLADHLLKSLKRKDACVYVEQEDSKVSGFVLASIEEWNGEDVCFIQYACIQPEAGENAGHELLSRVEKWAASMDIGTIVMVTKRNPEAYMRKYHFEHDGYIMKKGVRK